MNETRIITLGEMYCLFDRLNRDRVFAYMNLGAPALMNSIRYRPIYYTLNFLGERENHFLEIEQGCHKARALYQLGVKYILARYSGKTLVPAYYLPHLLKDVPLISDLEWGLWYDENFNDD